MSKKIDSGSLPLPCSIENAEKKEGGFPRVSILGYTGDKVSLRGYPYYIDDPVVYNMEGIEYKEKIPYLEDHMTLLGHTENIRMEGGNLLAEGVHSDPGEYTNTVYERITNGIPHQASMGLEIEGESVTYVAEGNVQVNGRSFEGPIFVVNKSRLTEMTCTLFGRDSNTEVKNSSLKEGLKILMSKKTDTPEPEKEAPPAAPVSDPVPEKVENSNPPAPTPSQDWLLDYLEYPALVKNARKQGWDQEKMEAEVAKLEAEDIENSYPGVPGPKLPGGGSGNHFLARLALGMGVKPETVENKLGKKVADAAYSEGGFSLKEALVVCANAEGGRFNGFSDVKNMNRFIKDLVVRNSFSTVNFPNLMHQVSQWRMEEAWEIEQPQSPAWCKEESSSDFRKSGRIKPGGGKMWEGFNDEGKLTHGQVGTEDKYETELDTIGQIMTFRRQDVINDDIGWIEETLDLMIEGALMFPDYRFLNLLLGAESAGHLVTTGTGQSKYTLALTRANLATVYKSARRRYTTKSSSDADKTVNGMFNTRFTLLVSPDLEDVAYDILSQDRYVAGTDTLVPEKNWMFNRLDLKVFNQMDNTSYNSNAASNNWAIIPNNVRYAPFYIRYLNRQKKPTTEVVDLPADELGFGVRGYWDVYMGYRPLENDKLQAFALSIPG